MFFVVFTSIITISHLYVFWRAASVPFLHRHVTQRGLTAIGFALWLLFVIGSLYGHTHDNTLSYFLELCAMTWMGFLFLLTASLLAVEVLTAGGWCFRYLTPSLRGFALTASLLLGGIALYQAGKAPVVDDFEVRLPGLPKALDGTAVVVMSDMHLGSLISEDWLTARIAQVRGLRPDLILLVGDIFEGHGDEHRQDRAAGLLRTMTAPLGVWGVPGNHEFYGGTKTIKALEGGGVKLLRNSWAEVRPGLVLAGIEEHNFAIRSERTAELIDKALTGRPDGATILLSHKPWGAEAAAKAGVGLMLSGHTHGGQIWPFNYLVGRFFPLLAGRYQVDSMSVLVCRGTGTWGAPMRLWEPGEIMKVTLRTGR